ncbi:Protein ArsC [Stieleria varia]|uniref:Protein ArsC n=3 Tax=Stieleria varia TaxID=2528005 RepID=A0A5C6A1Q5_9BACT|nr:Protein ArsC [Stieleria varia]
MMNQWLPPLIETVERIESSSEALSAQRQSLLDDATDLIVTALREVNGSDQSIGLNFICTHNSRRSHLAQLWAAVAVQRYQIASLRCFSGGTESTACNERIVRSLRRAGFSVVTMEPGAVNPHYWVQYDETLPPLTLYSKRFDANDNPTSHFIAMMCCDHADQACPIIHGSMGRVALDYRDPKHSDGLPSESQTYDQRRDEIGAEMFYLMRAISQRLET